MLGGTTNEVKGNKFEAGEDAVMQQWMYHGSLENGALQKKLHDKIAGGDIAYGLCAESSLLKLLKEGEFAIVGDDLQAIFTYYEVDSIRALGDKLVAKLSELLPPEEVVPDKGIKVPQEEWYEKCDALMAAASAQEADPDLVVVLPPTPKTAEDYVQEIKDGFESKTEKELITILDSAIALKEADLATKISEKVGHDDASLLQISISAGLYDLAFKLIEAGAAKDQLFGGGQLSIAEILIIRMYEGKKANTANSDGVYQVKYRAACKLLSKIAEGKFNIDKALTRALNWSIKSILAAPLSLKDKITEVVEGGEKSLLQSSIERGFYDLASKLIDLGATGSQEVLNQLLEAEYVKRAELGKKRRPGVAGFFWSSCWG